MSRDRILFSSAYLCNDPDWFPEASCPLAWSRQMNALAARRKVPKAQRAAWIRAQVLGARDRAVPR